MDESTQSRWEALWTKRNAALAVLALATFNLLFIKLLGAPVEYPAWMTIPMLLVFGAVALIATIYAYKKQSVSSFAMTFAALAGTSISLILQSTADKPLNTGEWWSFLGVLPKLPPLQILGFGLFIASALFYFLIDSRMSAIGAKKSIWVSPSDMFRYSRIYFEHSEKQGWSPLVVYFYWIFTIVGIVLLFSGVVLRN